MVQKAYPILNHGLKDFFCSYAHLFYFFHNIHDKDTEF